MGLGGELLESSQRAPKREVVKLTTTTKTLICSVFLSSYSPQPFFFFFHFYKRMNSIQNFPPGCNGSPDLLISIDPMLPLLLFCFGCISLMNFHISCLLYLKIIIINSGWTVSFLENEKKGFVSSMSLVSASVMIPVQLQNGLFVLVWSIMRKEELNSFWLNWCQYTEQSEVRLIYHSWESAL